MLCLLHCFISCSAKNHDAHGKWGVCESLKLCYKCQYNSSNSSCACFCPDVVGPVCLLTVENAQLVGRSRLHAFNVCVSDCSGDSGKSTYHPSEGSRGRLLMSLLTELTWQWVRGREVTRFLSTYQCPRAQHSLLSPLLTAGLLGVWIFEHLLYETNHRVSLDRFKVVFGRSCDLS